MARTTAAPTTATPTTIETIMSTGLDLLAGAVFPLVGAARVIGPPVATGVTASVPGMRVLGNSVLGSPSASSRVAS